MRTEMETLQHFKSSSSPNKSFNFSEIHYESPNKSNDVVSNNKENLDRDICDQLINDYVRSKPELKIKFEYVREKKYK